MELIPVVDLLGGAVVRGVQGNRQAYRPIESPLCGTSEPIAVAQVLVERAAARRLYIADLDAIQARPAHVAVLRELLAELPAIELWLDAGFGSAASAERLLESLAADAARVVAVFGSESLQSRDELERCFGPAGAWRERAALSLDRRGGTRLDPAGCWDVPARWPSRVIVMTLERVGSGAGPDLDTVADVRRQAPAARLVGAGGVRSEADLERAAAAGADAWLVASALHDLQLPSRRR
ncbi:MAG: nickel transporter [Proteobacteria bacterium]|nr:nickel transporter [Pseudomonadota bacterium]